MLVKCVGGVTCVCWSRWESQPKSFTLISSSYNANALHSPIAQDIFVQCCFCRISCSRHVYVCACGILMNNVLACHLSISRCNACAEFIERERTLFLKRPPPPVISSINPLAMWNNYVLFVLGLFFVCGCANIVSLSPLKLSAEVGGNCQCYAPAHLHWSSGYLSKT